MSEQSNVQTPWDARAKELEPVQGAYCDYVAWCEWLEQHNAQQLESLQVDFGMLDHDVKLAFFLAFHAACDRTAELNAAAHSSVDSPPNPDRRAEPLEPNRYKIRTVSDLYHIPEDRLEACLRTVALAIRTHRQIARAMPIECEPLQHLTWIDDGKDDMTINFVDGDQSITQT